MPTHHVHKVQAGQETLIHATLSLREAADFASWESSATGALCTITRTGAEQ